MKKALLISLFALLAAVCFGQEAAHLKFKGIPLDGNYKAFAQKLVQKGFKQIDITEDAIVMKGSFMAKPDVKVVITPDPATKTVSVVSAMIDAGDGWGNIENRYYRVVDIYTEKYGEPTEHAEEFNRDVYGDDYLREDALQDGQCNYHSQWEIEGGRIVIYLMYFDFHYYVVCSYADDVNVQALRQSILDDI